MAATRPTSAATARTAPLPNGQAAGPPLPLAEEILENIRNGSITAQSFVGGILRSDPQLKGPGDRYRARNGVLTRVGSAFG